MSSSDRQTSSFVPAAPAAPDPAEQTEDRARPVSPASQGHDSEQTPGPALPAAADGAGAHAGGAENGNPEPATVMPGRALRHRFEGPAYRRLMLGGIRLIPMRVKRLTMPLWGGIFYSLLPRARRAVESNLDRVLADSVPPGPRRWWQRKRLSYRLFVNYSQMLSDTYSLHMGLPIDSTPESRGREYLLDVLKAGKGVIAATGHLGHWQVAPFLAGWRGLARFCFAMAEEPNRQVQSFEQRFRERFDIIYTTASPFSILRLAQVLREGSVLGMQIDRNIGGQTVHVPFFGVPVAFPAGPAMLARVTGAPLVPNFFLAEVVEGQRRVVHYLEPPIFVERTRDRDGDILRATTALVAVYERYVRKYATQWYHFFDFFAPPPLAPSPHPAAESPAEGPQGGQGQVAQPVPGASPSGEGRS